MMQASDFTHDEGEFLVDQFNEQRTWIKGQAIPLITTDPTEPLDDLLPLQQLIGDASLVGLGEATHGSHEFFAMKHRLLTFLVEKMGFTMFAIEGSWSAGEKINRYILTGEGKIEELFQLFYFWTWRTQEVLELINWMRAYNADPQHIQKVMFAGFDCQHIQSNTYDAVIQYLRTVDPQSAARAESLYQDFRPAPGEDMRQHASSYYQIPQTSRQAYAEQARQVFDLLQQHQTVYIARSSSQAYEQVLQEARVIMQNVLYLSASLNLAGRGGLQGMDSKRDAFRDMSNKRDAFMVENTAWLHEHANGGTKMVLWAHNGHLQTAADTSHQPIWKRMGIHLRERYQSQYVAVGMSFYEGTFHSRGIDSEGSMTEVQPFHIQAIQDSYNALFGSIDLPLYLLDLRHIPEGSVKVWMGGPHPFLSLGAAYDAAATDVLDKHYSLPDLLRSFDLIIHFQQVTASQLLPFTLPS